MTPSDEKRMGGTWGSGGIRMAVAALLAALVLAALLGSSPAAPSPLETSRDAALVYLAALPVPADGVPGGGLAPYLVEAAIASGIDPAAWPSPEASALDALAFPAPGGPLMGLLRPAHAWAQVGGNLHDVGGRDVRGEILAAFAEGQFGDAGLQNDDAWALLALAADGFDMRDARIQAAAANLAASQRGGWGWQVGGASDTDSTGMALAALQAAGVRPDVEAALAFLASARAPDGGWSPEAPGDMGNCDSTVWALRGLAALGEADEAGWHFLLALQGPDGGFALQSGFPSNPLCTAEAATLLGVATAASA